ncbi:MAG: redoxin domain-containing protein [Mariprofundaceae bacterium]
MNIPPPIFKKIRSALFGTVLVALLGILYPNPAAICAEYDIPAPEISTSTWLNSPPLSLKDLKGKVVLVKFWTFGCFNCKNVQPYVKAWYEKYHTQGLEVIAVHSPEFRYEKNIANVQKYIEKEGVSYPVAIDNDFIIWQKYKNRAWPTMYLIDKQGLIRHKRIGEGGYTIMQNMIEKLLAETG